MLKALLALSLVGCGVTSLALRVSHVPFGEDGGDVKTPLHLDTAPADIATVDWHDASIACGRPTDIHVRHTHYTFTTVQKVMMIFLGGLGEGLGGTMFVALAKNDNERIAGGILLADAALAVAGALLWGQRAEIQEYQSYGLAWQCNPGDGIAIGDRVAQVDKRGALPPADLAALREELAAGKPFSIVVDRKLVPIPMSEAERCAATGGTQCEPAPSVAVTLTRIPSVLTLPMLPDPPPVVRR